MKNENQRDELIDKTTTEYRFLVAKYLEEGVSPGVISAALMRNIIDLMRVQGMSEMECSNNLYALVDGIREQAFEKKSVAH